MTATSPGSFDTGQLVTDQYKQEARQKETSKNQQ